MKDYCLLLIDPQNDFAASGEGGGPKGSLCVPGADKDMERVAHLISYGTSLDHDLSRIYVTLDSHQHYHIAHPTYWTNEFGGTPAPFSTITLNDLKNDIWGPSVALYKSVEKYLTKLEASGRTHMIWPPHCIIGEWGHGIYPVVAKALGVWSKRANLYGHPGHINYVFKGSNADTEHFSAIKAEVPNSDLQTKMNKALVWEIEKGADAILVAGIAGSHCVAATVRDMLRGFKSKKSVKRLVILRDTISPVPGCEKLQADFLSEMAEKGAQIMSTAEWIDLR